jgi:hypothetical protein
VAEATEVEADFSLIIVEVEASIKGVFHKGTQTTSPVLVIFPIIMSIPKIPNLPQTSLPVPHAKSVTNLDIQPSIATKG